jgi:hypothetical protein
VPIVLGGTAASALLFYLIVYPLNGTRAAIGSDSAVYVWWSRLAGAAGLGVPAIPGRPLIVGAVAALSDLTRIPEVGLVVSIGPVLSLATAAAIACLVYRAFDRDRVDFVLTVLLVNSFSVYLVVGFYSTLAFAAVFFAGVACLADGLERQHRASAFTAGALMGLAILAHPIFGILAFTLIVGGAIGLVWVADATVRRDLLRTRLLLVAAAVVVASLVVAVGLVSTGGPRGGLPTSADALLHDMGLRDLLVTSYRRRLISLLPPFLVMSAVAAFLLAAVVRPLARPRTAVPESTGEVHLRFLVGLFSVWLAVTVAGAGLLLMRFAVPAQRLVMFALFTPAIAAMALSKLVRRHSHDDIEAPGRGGGNRATVGILLCGIGVLALMLNYWIPWWGQSPQIDAAVAPEARASARLIAGLPEGTPLILVTEEREPQYVMDRVNYLRSIVPARRAPDVYAFIGGPVDFVAGTPAVGGSDDQDATAHHLWTQIPPRGSSEVAVVLRSFDPDAYATAALDPEWFVAADGVAVLDTRLAVAYRAGVVPKVGPTHGPDVSRPGPTDSPPWFALLSGVTLISVLTAVGIVWTSVILRTSPPLVRIGLSPAVGLGLVGAAAIVVDRIGPRLSSGGGTVAIVVVFALGSLTAAVRRS